MDTEHRIEFIKKRRVIKNEIKTWMCLCMVLGMAFVVCLVTELYGKTMFIISVITSIILIALNIYYFAIRKKSLKYNLLLGSVMMLDFVFPVFYLFCLSYYEIFGYKYLVLLFLLPFLITCLLLFWVNIVLIKRKTPDKTKTKTLPFFSGSLLCGLSILIGRRINAFLSITVSENFHFLLIAYPFLLLVCLVSTATSFDLLRYYYYTKLKKMGLVTEDILKPEK